MPISFGAKNRFAGLYPSTKGNSPWSYGGFGVGGPPPVQSSVASPNPTSAGVSGQPPMSGGRVDEQEQGGGQSASTPTGNANVTGLNPSLIGHGLTFGSMGPLGGMVGLPSAGSTVGKTVGQATQSPIAALAASLLTGMGFGEAKSAATKAASNAFGMTTPNAMTAASGTNIPAGSPVTYGGEQTGLLGFLANSLGIPTGSLIASVPSPMGGFGVGPTNPALPGEITGVTPQSLSVEVPSQTPNMFSLMGDPTGVPGGVVGAHTAGHPFGVPSNDPTNNMFHPEHGKYAYPDAPPWGLLDANKPDLPDEPDPFPEGTTVPSDIGLSPTTGLSNTGDPQGEGQLSSDPSEGGGNSGDTGVSSSGDPGPGDSSDVGVSSSGDPGPGDSGDAGAGPGDGGVGSAGDSGGPGAFKKGGKVKRPDPKKLAARLKNPKGKIRAGDDDDHSDDVPARLTKGEFVVDKNSTKEFEPLLKQINDWGGRGPRSRGGFNVGAQRSR